MPYTTPTFTDAREALAQRLADPGMTRWVAAELDVYLRESVRTWNAYTASYRRRGTFQTTTQQAWYDLPTVVGAIRGYNVTVYDLLTDLQYKLMEPPSPSAWAGSEQFTLSDLLSALQRRRDQFFRETSAILTRSSLPISPSPVGRYSLPQEITALRRVAWLDPDGLITPLMRDDTWGASAYHPAWPQNPRRRPTVYATSATPPLQVQMVPAPQDTGALDILAVETGPAWAEGLDAIVGVPDDWTWVLSWGALADLLGRDGLAIDMARAAYAEARWTQGIQAAAAAPVVLTGAINEVTARVGSVNDADRYNPLWQSVPGVPRELLTAGQNMVACFPPPGVLMAGGDWSVTVDVVANMPVTDAMQVGVDVYDTILDYAQHLALFKEGPSQLDQSQSLMQRFFRAAGVTLNLQQAQQPSRKQILSQTTQDQRGTPAQLPSEPVEVL